MQLNEIIEHSNDRHWFTFNISRIAENYRCFTNIAKKWVDLYFIRTKNYIRPDNSIITSYFVLIPVFMIDIHKSVINPMILIFTYTIHIHKWILKCCKHWLSSSLLCASVNEIVSEYTKTQSIKVHTDSIILVHYLKD